MTSALRARVERCITQRIVLSSWVIVHLTRSDRPSPAAACLDQSARDEPIVQSQTQSTINGNTKPSSEASKIATSANSSLGSNTSETAPPKPSKRPRPACVSLRPSSQGLAVPKVDVVYLALQLFLVARIGFRAVSRVLSLLAVALGIKKAPCPQTIINWVMRLSIVRIESARLLQGLPLSQAPFTNGLIWMIDISIGLGSGQDFGRLGPRCPSPSAHSRLPPAWSRSTVLGCRWPRPGRATRLPTLLKRLIALMGRPAAYLKDGGSELHKAVDLLEEQGLASPCIDDISHAVASMLKRATKITRASQTFVSACGRVSGKLKHTILACLAPPNVRTKARFMNVHRLFTWADRVLQLSPAGGAKAGSTLAKLRACLDALPACKALIKRFRADASAAAGVPEDSQNPGALARHPGPVRAAD